MLIDNDPELIGRMRAMHRRGEGAVAQLLMLAGHGLSEVGMMSSFREAYGLAFDDVSCIGGWFPEGGGELSDDAVGRLLDGAIAAAAGAGGVRP
jgi:hypothetical protein